MTVVTVHDGDDLIFRGRVIETTQDIDGIVSVYCEGELAFLVRFRSHAICVRRQHGNAGGPVPPTHRKS